MKKETQITEVKNFSEKKTQESKKMKFRTEAILFLIFGFLLGVVVKTEAGKRIVIGFEDYKISALHRGYDLNQIQKDMAEKEKVE